MMLIYFVLRAIRKGELTRILLKITRLVISCVFVVCILAAVVFYGGFIVRYPLLGGISAPPVIFLALYFLPKVHFFNLMKRYLP